MKGRRQREGKGAASQQSCPAACGLWRVLVFAVTGRDTCVHKHHSLAGHRSQREAGGGRQAAEWAQGKLVGREVGCISLDLSCHVLFPYPF